MLCCVLFLSCQNPAGTNFTHMKDPHSFAEPEKVVVRHLDLNLKVDFKNKQLSGTAKLDIENLSGESELVLDSRDLSIEKITIDNGGETPFHLEAAEPVLGQALRIHIRPLTKQVTIIYKTSPDAAAVQWLSPEQTAGKKHPFLFTQSQAILARTWVPIQDSPGIRFTYDATVTVPKELLAVMSAENPQKKSSDGVYHFKMPQPIPAYLLALAVGDLSFESFDNRTGVYSEPSTIKKAAYEFAELPQMVNAAEKLYGPYEWGRYDLLVLPPSFPFGGMENPRLTFCTPTILAGDRSLTSLVAHELAHSWSGNLVTNATWNDFWLNEGFTVYFENRIMEALYGKDFDDMQKLLGQEDLRHTIDELGDTSVDTHLKLQLNGRDPDDGMTDVAYEKGANLLLLIEQKVGREKLDAFLINYFKQNAFKSKTTEQFLEDIKTLDNIDQKIDFKKWIYGPGFPAEHVTINSKKFEHVDQEVKKYLEGAAAATLDTAGWSAFEWIRFVRALPEKISVEKMRDLDSTFNFSKTGNNEILFEWLQHVIASNYEPAYSALENFLVQVGRRKFVKPLYQELVKTSNGKVMAKNIYSKARGNYHSVTRNTIDEIVGK